MPSKLSGRGKHLRGERPRLQTSPPSSDPASSDLGMRAGIDPKINKAIPCCDSELVSMACRHGATGTVAPAAHMRSEYLGCALTEISDRRFDLRNCDSLGPAALDHNDVRITDEIR